MTDQAGLLPMPADVADVFDAFPAGVAPQPVTGARRAAD